MEGGCALDLIGVLIIEHVKDDDVDRLWREEERVRGVVHLLPSKVPRIESDALVGRPLGDVDAIRGHVRTRLLLLERR